VQLTPTLQPGGFYPWLAARLATREAQLGLADGVATVTLAAVVAARTALGFHNQTPALGLPEAMCKAILTMSWTLARIDLNGYLQLETDHPCDWPSPSGHAVPPRRLCLWMPITGEVAEVLIEAARYRPSLSIWPVTGGAPPQPADGPPQAWLPLSISDQAVLPN
jgi:hypothetical protein